MTNVAAGSSLPDLDSRVHTVNRYCFVLYKGGVQLSGGEPVEHWPS